MARLAWYLAAIGLLVISCVARGEQIPEDDRSVDGTEEDIEIAKYDEAADESIERVRRDAPKTQNSESEFIRYEKTSTGDHIIWRDNSETRKKGYVPTVTKVLYHGIYPSLNITVPLNENNGGRYRQKRGVTMGDSGSTADTRSSTWSTGTTRTTGSSTSGSIGTAITTGDTRQTEGSTARVSPHTFESMQQTQPGRTLTPYPTPTYLSEKPIGGSHYQQADHSTLSNPYPPLNTARPQYKQAVRYRTMYYPSGTVYQGDPENKGRVRMISVGYYSINESTADLRSYRNPKVERNSHNAIRTAHRAKRDTNWAWLDKFFKSIWANPETSEQENDIPRSEPLTMALSEVREEAQGLYGYSSNGHSHQKVDKIYLQNDLIQNPNPTPKSILQTTSTSTTPPTNASPENSSSESEHAEHEDMPLPDRPILIQAPKRKIACRPPKRLARGRCRTVW